MSLTIQLEIDPLTREPVETTPVVRVAGSAELAAALAEASEAGNVTVVRFMAKWCPSCKRMVSLARDLMIQRWSRVFTSLHCTNRESTIKR